MKTTVEIPDDLFRKAKAKAALEGIPLRELVERGLRLAMEQPSKIEPQGRTNFPLILGTPGAKLITDEQVAQALEQMDEEEMAHYASFM